MPRETHDLHACFLHVSTLSGACCGDRGMVRSPDLKFCHFYLFQPWKRNASNTDWVASSKKPDAFWLRSLCTHNIVGIRPKSKHEIPYVSRIPSVCLMVLACAEHTARCVACVWCGTSAVGAFTFGLPVGIKPLFIYLYFGTFQFGDFFFSKRDGQLYLNEDLWWSGIYII